MADPAGGNNTTVLMREYKKGNWTVDETMFLIEAKKMDDERRMKKSGDHGEGRGKPTELRWKWVEDYCWSKGCLRSQNQCNDKWDNLMREYKKVREHQKRIADGNEGSYWEMEKNERKEKNLPSNMLRQIYELLEEVVEKKGGRQRLVVAAAGSSASGPINPNIPYNVMERAMITSVQASQPPHLMVHQISDPIPEATPLPLPAPPLLPPSAAASEPVIQPPPISYAQPLPTLDMCDSSDSDTSEYSDSPAKRRRRGSGNGEGTSGTASENNNSNEVGTAISKSASIIAEAIQASEEREERRHRDLVSLRERRLEMEESKIQINKRGMDGLVDAINKLANSIFALASQKNQPSASK